MTSRDIPLKSRFQARYRPTNCEIIPDTKIETLEGIIRSGHDVVVDLNWGHVWLLVGYNRTKRFFEVKNSWGGTSLTNRPYDQAAAEIIGGTFITDIAPPNTAPSIRDMWIGRWQMDHDGWRGELVIRRLTNQHNSNPDAATKLGNYYRDGKSYDVNGYFVQGGRGMVFYVADAPGRIQPGVLAGQRFESYIFSFDPENAAGITEWQGTNYGLTMSRSSIPGTSAQNQNVSSWIGTWQMNHDGWRGVLELENIIPIISGQSPTGPA